VDSLYHLMNHSDSHDRLPVTQDILRASGGGVA